MRVATTDTEIAGQAIAKDDRVYGMYPAANRDPLVFEEPFEFNIERKFPRDHVTFSFGEHLCVGAPVARLELRIVFEQLAARFPRLQLAGPPDIMPTTFLKHMTAMPVVFQA
jgi:cytochrome P450 family 142 subfamily A polypeptide 1